MPAQAPVLAPAAAGGPRHETLSTRVAKIGVIEDRILLADEQLFARRGKLLAHLNELRAFRVSAEASHQVHRQLTAHAGKRAIMRLSKQRSSLASLARRDLERARQLEQENRVCIAQLLSTIQQAEQDKASLQHLAMERRELVQELDKFHASIYVPLPATNLTPLYHTCERNARFQLEALTDLANKLRFESEREKHMRRDYLGKANKTAQELLACVRKAIAKTTDIRIKSRIPTRKEILNGHEYELTRTIAPILQMAKILSGRLFTIMAQARVANIGVAALPEMTIVELHKLPTRRAAEHDKGSLHQTLESSFAQATWCINHVAREKERSIMRQHEIAQLSKDNALLAEKARDQLRTVRSAIVHAVYTFPLEGEWDEPQAQVCLAEMKVSEPTLFLPQDAHGNALAFQDPDKLPSVQPNTLRMLRAHLVATRKVVDEAKPPLQGLGLLEGSQFRKDALTADPDFFLDPGKAGYEYMPGADIVFGKPQGAPSRLLLMSGQRGAEDLEKKPVGPKPKEDQGPAPRPVPTIREPEWDIPRGGHLPPLPEYTLSNARPSTVQPSTEETPSCERPATPPQHHHAEPSLRWSPNTAPIRNIVLEEEQGCLPEGEALTVPALSTL